MIAAQQDPLQGFATRVVLRDLDCDGKTDALLDNDQALGVWLGDGKGGFRRQMSFPWFTGEHGAFSSLATYDFAGNGIPDVVDSAGSVFLNRGHGNLAAAIEVTPLHGLSSRGLVLVDLDRDGLVDLVTGAYGSGDIHIELGAGGGKFRNEVIVPTGASTETIATADFNGDGLPDLVISDFIQRQLIVLLNRSR